jgi:hypothetical protein
MKNHETKSAAVSVCAVIGLINEIYGSHGCDYEDYCLLRPEAVWSGTLLPLSPETLLRI